MKRGLVLYALGLLIVAAACNRSPALTAVPTKSSLPALPVPAGSLVILNGTVISGTGDAPITDGAVVLQGERILSVGRAADYAIPSSVRVVDARGGTILPGIINAHVHGTSSPAVRRVYFLLKGVTSVCDMGAPLKAMPTFALDHSLGPSARGFRSGPVITAPGGYPDIVWAADLNYEVRSPEEARAAVADLVERGADVIKVALEPGSIGDPWPMLNLQEVEAVVREAHARGRLVRAHVGNTKGTAVLETLLSGGIDIIDHVPLPVFSGRDAFDLLKGSGHYEMTVADKDGLAQLARRGLALVPTLSAHTLWCRSAELTSEQQEGCYAFYQDPVREFHAAGGTLALANDYGADDTLEKGVPLLEMKLLLGAGLTPMEVIEASTKNAARVCGHGEELGTLEPGKLADVIILKGNPLEGIEAMSRVLTVIKGGEIVLPADPGH